MLNELLELYRIGAIKMPRALCKILSGFDNLKARQEKKAYVASKLRRYSVIKGSILKEQLKKTAARNIQSKLREMRDKTDEELTFEIIDKQRR